MVDLAKASALATIAEQVSADVLSGPLPYPSDLGGGRLGDLELNEHLDRYRNQRLVLIVAPVGPGSFGA